MSKATKGKGGLGWHWKEGKEGGEPGRCSTTPESCPIGGPHFLTKKEAYEAYEASRGRAFPVTQQLTKRELNETAKTAELTPELVEQILTNGSNLTLRNLTKNPNVTSDALEAAYQKSDNLETQQQLARHELFPKDSLRGEAFLDSIANDQYGNAGKLNGINDEHLMELTKRAGKVTVDTSRRAALSRAIRSPDNQVSDEVRANVAESESGSILTNAAMSGRYPAHRVASLNAQQISWLYSGAEKVQDTELVTAVAEWSVANKDTGRAESIASNPNSPPDALEVLGRNEMSVGYVVSNPNTPPDVRANLAKKYPEAASIVKLQSLEKKYGKVEDYLIADTDHRSNGRGWNEYTFTLDKAKVAELDLSELDVKTAFGFFKAKFSGGFSYNSESGVIKAAIDSSG